MLFTCFVAGNAQASDTLPKSAAPRAHDQETVITAERSKAEAVPEPTGLLMSCLLGGVLLAIGQRVRFWRGGAA